MTPERHKKLTRDLSLTLTPDEINEGWRFCMCEWDGMLVNINDEEGEGRFCRCFKEEETNS